MSRQRRWLAVVLASVASLSSAGIAEAAPNPSKQLVEAYSPIVMLRVQEDPPCDDSAEQYQPTTVNTVLGNPKVELIPPAGSSRSRRPAPTAADIAGLGNGYHLDLPGDPLQAGCTYARDFATLVEDGEAPAITYAHIRRQPGEGKLVVQYWFYYYFNQFNDLHESDWEGMQIVFDAISARAALSSGPSEIGLFQHGGGEKADWEDEKVEKQGNHPIVYPAAGSHATFYGSAIYIENGQRGSGLGCDNASEPLRRLALRPVLVPTHPRPGSRFQWLTYEGRWGQQEEGFNNGPTGPNTKLQWLKPLATMDSLRSSSPTLPVGSLYGPTVTGAFCGAVATVSSFINLQAQTPIGALILALIAVLLVLVPAALTRWRPVSLAPLRERAGIRPVDPRGASALRPSLAHHGRARAHRAGRRRRVLRTRIGGRRDRRGDLLRRRPGRHQPLVRGPGHGTRRLDRLGDRLRSRRHLRARARARPRRSGRSSPTGRCCRGSGGSRSRQLLATLVVIAIALTLIGIPIAIRKYVDWQFVQQEVLFENKRIRDAFRGSSRLVRGRWWYTVRVAGFLWLLTVSPVPCSDSR